MTVENSAPIAYVERPEGVDPQLIELFNLLEAMPDSLQEALAQLLLKGIALIVERQREHDLYGLHRAGAERVKVFYQLELFWPRIARTSLLHQALKAAILLDEMGQTALCHQFFESIHLVALYLRACEARHQRPQPRQISRILGLALQESAKQARDCLQGFEDAMPATQ